MKSFQEVMKLYDDLDLKSKQAVRDYATRTMMDEGCERSELTEQGIRNAIVSLYNRYGNFRAIVEDAWYAKAHGLFEGYKSDLRL